MPDGTWAEVRGWIGAEVGYGESPRGSNRTKFAMMAGHANGYAWCASFVSAALRQNNVPVPRKILSASSRTMYAEAKAAGLAIPIKNVLPGDVLHLTRGPRNAWLGHVGFCIEVLKDGRLRSIEGNTSTSGSATGGSVLIHTRPASDWTLGAWRPRYTPPKPPAKTLWVIDGAIAKALTMTTAEHVKTPAEVVALQSQGWTFRPTPPHVTLV